MAYRVWRTELGGGCRPTLFTRLKPAASFNHRAGRLMTGVKGSRRLSVEVALISKGLQIWYALRIPLALFQVALLVCKNQLMFTSSDKHSGVGKVGNRSDCHRYSVWKQIHRRLSLPRDLR